MPTCKNSKYKMYSKQGNINLRTILKLTFQKICKCAGSAEFSQHMTVWCTRINIVINFSLTKLLAYFQQ